MVSRECGITQLCRSHIHILRARSVDTILFAQIDGGSGKIEGRGNHPRESIQQVDDVSRYQHLLADVVKTLRLALATARDLRLAARLLRKLARNDTCNQKCEQRDPVAPLANGKGHDRGEEEE